MKRNRFILIGLGNIGQDLLKRLPKEMELLCVDIHPETEERVKKIRGEGAQAVVGDATSRLVLEKTGVDDADGVVITLTEEKVAVEVATILKERFHPKRVIAVGITAQGVECLESLGVEVQNLFTTSSISIRNMMERTAKTPHSFGLGKNEILEVEVHPNSKLANKPLTTLAPVKWKVGIIYREGNIVIPGRETILKPRDKVIILGDPTILKTVSELLTFSFEKFPLEYGAQVLCYLTGKEDEVFFRELAYIYQVFPLGKLFILYSPKAVERSGELDGFLAECNVSSMQKKEIVLPPLEAVREMLEEQRGGFGLLLLSKSAFIDSSAIFFTNGARKSFLLNLISLASCPLWLLKGTFPYEKVALPGIRELDVEHVLETAFEIASSLRNEITVLQTTPSVYIASEEEAGECTAMKKAVSDMALMHKMSVETRTLEGNPVRSIVHALQDYNLILTDTGQWKRRRSFASFLNPDVMWHIVRESPVSTLIIPPEEESL